MSCSWGRREAATCPEAGASVCGPAQSVVSMHVSSRGAACLEHARAGGHFTRAPVQPCGASGLSPPCVCAAAPLGPCAGAAVLLSDACACCRGMRVLCCGRCPCPAPVLHLPTLVACPCSCSWTWGVSWPWPWRVRKNVDTRTHNSNMQVWPGEAWALRTGHVPLRQRCSGDGSPHTFHECERSRWVADKILARWRVCTGEELLQGSDARLVLFGDRSHTWPDEAACSEFARLEEPFAVVHKAMLHILLEERNRDAAPRAKPRRSAAHVYQRVQNLVQRIASER